MPIKNIKNRGKLILFDQLSSILFVGYFVTAPFLLYSLYKTDLIGPLIKGQKNRGNTEYRPGKNFTVYCLVLIILHNFIPIVNYITIGFFSNIICIKTLYNISVNNMKT